MSEYELQATLNNLENYELQANLENLSAYTLDLHVDLKPDKTSQLVNDGEDGNSPYATEEYVDEHIKILPDYSEEDKGKVLTVTDNSELEWSYAKEPTYIHNQSIASDEWIIEHNLGKYPAIDVVDSAGTVVKGQRTYINENTLSIKFNGAFKGIAYLN